MLIWAYHQRVSRLKNVAEKLKIRYGKNKTISVRVKGRLDPISASSLIFKEIKLLVMKKKTRFLIGYSSTPFKPIKKISPCSC